MSRNQPKPGSKAVVSDGEPHVWPLRRYSPRDRSLRLLGGSILGGALALWVIVCWPSLTMRVVALGLLAVIGWAVAPAVFDQPRPTERQITVDEHGLSVRAARAEVSVAWRDVKRAQWRQDRRDAFGLWLYDGDGRILAHLDASLLADQDEARAFVKWARQVTGRKLDIEWAQV